MQGERSLAATCHYKYLHFDPRTGTYNVKPTR